MNQTRDSLGNQRHNSSTNKSQSPQIAHNLVGKSKGSNSSNNGDIETSIGQLYSGENIPADTVLSL